MFGKKKEQVIKFDQSLCKANALQNEVLFVKVKEVVNTKNAYVEIPQSHTALIVKGGSDVRYYKEGPVRVFDEKSEVKDWKRGFSVEVIYIAKAGKLTVFWGTPNKIMFRDEASNHVVNVAVIGEFDVSICNPLQFYSTTAVSADEFNRENYGDMFRSIVVNQFTDIFLKVLKAKQLTYDQCDENKKEIGENIGEILNNKFQQEYGVSVKNFIIDKFVWDNEDKAAIEEAAAEKKKQDKLKEYLAEIERLDDKQWEREKYLRQLELQDKNAYYEVLKVIGKGKNIENEQVNKCPACGFECKPTDKFCPHCGKRVSKDPIVCPDCGKANEYTAVFCANCGKKLV